MKRSATYYFILLGALNLLLLLVMKEQAKLMPRIFDALLEGMPLPIITEWVPSVWWWPGVFACVSFVMAILSLISRRWQRTLHHLLITLLFIQCIFSWLTLTGYFLPFIQTLSLGSNTYDWLYNHERQKVFFSSDNLDPHVGEQLTLVGELIDHKNPTVHGVHVGYPKVQDGATTRKIKPEELLKYAGELTSNHAVVYKRVIAHGVLVRIVQDGADPFAPANGTNIYYNLIDTWTGDLAEPIVEKK